MHGTVNIKDPICVTVQRREFERSSARQHPQEVRRMCELLPKFVITLYSERTIHEVSHHTVFSTILLRPAP